MQPDEYARMRAAENHHWWYVGLRGLLQDHLRRFPSEGPLLDAGCGTGGTLHALGRGTSAIGIDHSPLALRACQERGLPNLARADVTALPFGDAAFGAVISMDVLYHRQVDPASALAEYRRVLRPGGRVYINVPAYEWLRSPHDTVIQTGRRFTRRQVRGMLLDAGLEIELLTHWNALLLLAIASARLLGSGQGSDLERPTPAWVNGMLGQVLALERAVMRMTPLPCGVSIFAVVVKR